MTQVTYTFRRKDFEKEVSPLLEDLKFEDVPPMDHKRWKRQRIFRSKFGTGKLGDLCICTKEELTWIPVLLELETLSVSSQTKLSTKMLLRDLNDESSGDQDYPVEKWQET